MPKRPHRGGGAFFYSLVQARLKKKARDACTTRKSCATI
jgi:hypothetical protein